MGGQGPAPKDPSQRSGTAIPKRGEWQDLPPLASPILPELEGEWSYRTREMWDGWRADWVTQTFGPSEVAMAIGLAYLHEQAVSDPRQVTQRWTEVRQWMDRLGFTMKGKRDLRLRLAEVAEEKPKAGKHKSSLRLVDSAVPA